VVAEIRIEPSYGLRNIEQYTTGRFGMEEAKSIQSHANSIVTTRRSRDLHVQLAALAIKEPFLRPVCDHLGKLITAGCGDSHSASRLLEYIVASLPAAEADFWRHLLVRPQNLTRPQIDQSDPDEAPADAPGRPSDNSSREISVGVSPLARTHPNRPRRPVPRAPR